MKIPAEKEFAIKKAILKAIEHGYSPAQLADSFGVSKSLIYKYRRALRDQGFIRKNENDMYVIIQNKFSIKPRIPESGKLDLDNDIKDQPQPNLQASNQELEQPIIDEPKPDVSRTEIKFQEKLQQIREIQLQQQQNAANQDKGLFKKIIGKFKKII
ncbi:hypothetical protein BSY87_05295 [Francisella tularensis subsp. holarctica FSC022]|uniref:FTL_1293 family small RNA FtrC-regulated protein n=1 Tax=Francisella tularensis TaxID=263 RepID=UPI00015D7841|nr:hypothetical protein [Francisella tularensis]EDO66710.1 conserved hypothetical protein [Francisella tularensis subsp. holarctica FSC022]KIP30918.1 helix-turn-helix domain protein [Francisella tularensis subsp. holarctica]MCC9172142.1 hypothetical protein [Francisella tularensis]OPH23665.1 hypothetical protein BSY87_05295 [Francisella tularensis subsp. holarctica FSC022]